MAETRNTYMIHADGNLGEVQIADEVVTIIAGLAATEVEGVASMAGNITNELVSKLGMKNLSKGVKAEIVDNNVSVDLALNLKYGYNIPETSEKVQDPGYCRYFPLIPRLTVEMWIFRALEISSSIMGRRRPFPRKNSC